MRRIGVCNLKLHKCQYSNKLYRMKHYYCRTVCQNLLYEIQVTNLTVLTTHCYFTRLNLKKWALSSFAFQSF